MHQSQLKLSLNTTKGPPTSLTNKFYNRGANVSPSTVQNQQFNPEGQQLATIPSLTRPAEKIQHADEVAQYGSEGGQKPRAFADEDGYNGNRQTQQYPFDNSIESHSLSV